MDLFPEKLVANFEKSEIIGEEKEFFLDQEEQASREKPASRKYRFAAQFADADLGSKIFRQRKIVPKSKKWSEHAGGAANLHLPAKRFRRFPPLNKPLR